MLKIKKNDIVEVTKGKDRGKRGKVLKVFLSEKKAIVEGTNFFKKHKRRTQRDQQGGIVSIEAPIITDNLAVVCKRCNRPVRIGFSLLNDSSKSRICKICKEAI